MDAIIFEAGGFNDAKRLAQFCPNVRALPFLVIDLLNLLVVLAKGVDGRTARFGKPLGFDLLALKSDETAGELVGDLSAATAVFLLFATKFLEFVLLAFEILLLTAQRDQMFARQIKFVINLFAMLRQINNRKHRPGI